MIKFKTYSNIKRGQEIGGFYLYSPEELLEDLKEEGRIKVYGGFSIYNIQGFGIVVDKHQISISEGYLCFSDMKENMESYFKMNSSPKAFRAAWFKTRKGAERFIEKYGKENTSGKQLGFSAPSIMFFNE